MVPLQEWIPEGLQVDTFLCFPHDMNVPTPVTCYLFAQLQHLLLVLRFCNQGLVAAYLSHHTAMQAIPLMLNTQ